MVNKKWIFKPNSAGLIDLNDPDCFVDGDKLYYYQGNTVLLNGTYHFTENYSPQGYQAVEDFLIYHHNQSTQEKIVQFNPITVKEKWKLMVQVAKLDENDNYLSGAKLQLLSDKYRLITNFVSLDSPIDISQYVQEGESYILREEEAPEGYFPHEQPDLLHISPVLHPPDTNFWLFGSIYEEGDYCPPLPVSVTSLSPDAADSDSPDISPAILPLCYAPDHILPPKIVLITL